VPSDRPPPYPPNRRAKFQEEIKQLEQAKNDLQLEHTFVLDKFRQLKAENDRLRAEIDGFKGKLTAAEGDYVSRSRSGASERLPACRAGARSGSVRLEWSSNTAPCPAPPA
jgi:hypothetical protein